MSHHFMNPYMHGHSLIHRWPASLKLVGSASLVLTLVLVPSGAWRGYGVVGIFLILFTTLSRFPWTSVLKKLLWLEPLAMGMALLSLFQPNGMHQFLVLLTKSTLSLWTMVLLSSTTRFSDMISVLRRLYVPALLLTTLTLMVRYLIVIFDEMHRMKHARESRTFGLVGRSSWRTMATVVAHLFVRSSERAERVYSAMCARGWKA